MTAETSTLEKMPIFESEARNLISAWEVRDETFQHDIRDALERAYNAGGINTTGALLLAVTDIRQVTGLGGKPMLSELGAAVRGLLADKDAQIGKLSFRLNTPPAIGRPVSTIEELIVGHVGKTGACIYAKLASALKHRAQKPELMEKLNELAAAGKLFITHNVKRSKGRAATIISIRPFNASTIYNAPKSTPKNPSRNAAPTRVATERMVRLAIRALRGKGTIHQIVDEMQFPEMEVLEVLNTMTRENIVQANEINGTTYYKIYRPKF